jgi:hypothetical protein
MPLPLLLLLLRVLVTLASLLWLPLLLPCRSCCLCVLLRLL